VKVGSEAEAVSAVVSKIAAGADIVLTQCLYDAAAYGRFVKACRAAGVPERVPIVPGVLPVHGWRAFQNMTAYTGVGVPAPMLEALQEAAVTGDDEAVRAVGHTYMLRLCEALLEAGAPGLHFYTLNLEGATRAALRDLGLARGSEARRLPWRPLGDGPRSSEQVRPIFWANRPRSYVERTREWSEQPTGRWGDGESPAFGALSESHFGATVTVLGSSEVRRALWGEPEALASGSSVCDVFARYLEGAVARLPWCDQALLPETAAIRSRLIALNRAGFCTINSQPRVNGAKSDDPTVGWGGPGGRVYQKGYVECFCSPALLGSLMEAAAAHPFVTFTAVDQAGNLYTNCKRRGVQAVTWGVFPGKEVLQPTVVDEAAFLAWKEEAFQLWQSVWASAYPEDSVAAETLHDIQSQWFLVHVVDHDFVSGDVLKPFEAAVAAAAPAAREAPAASSASG
jgi:methylenetetrahydrofolate reductase (NADPH)